MGCACKTNQQISYLQRKYGNNQPKSKATHIRESLSIGTKKIVFLIALIPIMPIVGIIMMIQHAFSKKPISIKKTFKIAQ